MKVLHSKTAAEPILLVSACPTMNLFAIVTQRVVVVYRSTTLTALATITLADVDVLPKSAASASSVPAKLTSGAEATSFKACWTPSGSIFTLALPSGVVLLIDVESGELIRRLVPTREPSSTTSQGTRPFVSGLATTAGAKHVLSTMDDEEEGERTRRHHLAGSTAEAPEANGGNDDDDDDDVRAFHRRCRRALWRAPAIPLTTTIGEPVCALTWVRVSSPAPLPTTTTAMSTAASPRRSVSCPPLQNSITAPLLGDLGGVYAMSKSSAGSGDGDGDALTATSVLVVLDALGGLSLVQGGLYEVDRLQVQLPPSVHPRTGTLEVQQFTLIESPASTSATTTTTASAVVPESLSFSDLATHWIAAHFDRTASKGLTSSSTQGTVAHASLIADACRCHYGVLQLGPRRSTDASTCPQAGSPVLLLLPLASRLGALGADSTSAALCFIGECARLAETCHRLAMVRWEHTLRAHTRRALQLPEKAALLHDALVEEVSLPDPVALLAYYQSLPRDRLARAGELLETTLASVGVDMLSVVNGCQQAALQVAQAQQQASSTPCTTRPDERDWPALVTALARQQRLCEAWVACVRVEAQTEAYLVQWVRQRASLTLALEGLDDGDTPAADGSTVTIPVPLPVAQHPRLLRALRCIQMGQSTSWETSLGSPKDATTGPPVHQDEEGRGAHVAGSTRSRGVMESHPVPHDSASASSVASTTSAPACPEAAYRAIEVLLQRLWASGSAHSDGLAGDGPVELVEVALDSTGMHDGAAGALLSLDFLPAGADDASTEDEDAEEAEEEGEDGVGDIGQPSATSSAPPLARLFSVHVTQLGEAANTSLVLCTTSVAPPPSSPPASCLRASCTQRMPVALAEACADEDTEKSPAALGALACFITLAPERHLLVFSKAAKGSTSTGTVTTVIVQGDGHVEMAEVDDEDDDADEDDDDAQEAVVANEEAGGSEAEEASAVKPVVLALPGIEAPLQIAVSRSREFGVLAAQNKFVVLELYQE